MLETNGVNWHGEATSYEGIVRPEIAAIADRWRTVSERVAAAAVAAGRPEDSVSVLLAAKFQEPERVLAALLAGGTKVGHNYIQQLEASEIELRALASKSGAPAEPSSTAPAEPSSTSPGSSGSVPTLRSAQSATGEGGVPRHGIHVIGHVQSNKAAKALKYADCIETLDTMKLARRLDRLQGERIAAGHLDHNGLELGPFNVMIQVNAAGSDSQYGEQPERVVDLVCQVAELEHLKVTGLMLIGAHTDDVAEIARSHARVRELRDEAIAAGVTTCTELSMGMTDDMEIAIAEGSTQVRIGTAVFGPRPVMI